MLTACNGSTTEQAAPSAPREPATAIVREVVWPDAKTIDRAARAALPAKADEAVRASSVPVLLPPGAKLLASAVVIAKPTWTSASMRDDGVTIVVTATRAAHAVPRVGPVQGDRSIRGTHGFVTQNERVWSASWVDDGVARSVDVECERGDDARCADDAFVTGLARDLVYVGGAGELGGPGNSEASPSTSKEGAR